MYINIDTHAVTLTVLSIPPPKTQSELSKNVFISIMIILCLILALNANIKSQITPPGFIMVFTVVGNDFY